MNITKVGHCCLLIETKGKRILTDPGAFTTDTMPTESIDIVLITHEHADHFHIPALQQVLKGSPQATVYTNSGVGKLLTEASIPFVLLEGRDMSSVLGIVLEAFDAQHAEIYEDFGQVQNTGYFVDETLFYPGDAYIDPGRAVEVLACPFGGPWWKVSDAMEYILTLKPAHVFPVHDGIEREDRVGILHRVPLSVLPHHNITFHPLKAGESFSM
jgi:L-ascorbate metabolism protein UlaG (beta-lactamase superfamily)